MKPCFTPYRIIVLRVRTILCLAVALALFIIPAEAVRGQIYVVNPNAGGSILEYNLDGAPLNVPLITGVGPSVGVVFSEGKLYVARDDANVIGVYDATTGDTINGSLVSGTIQYPHFIAVSNGHLYVADDGNARIGEYDATTGAAINPALVTGLISPSGIAISDGYIYVTGQFGTIGKYDATTGATVNASLITGLGQPIDLAIFDGHLFVTDYGGGRGAFVGEFNLDGTAVNRKLIDIPSSAPTGIDIFGGHIFVTNAYAYGTVSEFNLDGTLVNAALTPQVGGTYLQGISVVPEPSTFVLMTVGIGALFGVRRLTQA